MFYTSKYCTEFFDDYENFNTKLEISLRKKKTLELLIDDSFIMIKIEVRKNYLFFTVLMITKIY